jgi:tetratricopeptide (TPR) repeat protein
MKVTLVKITPSKIALAASALALAAFTNACGGRGAQSNAQQSNAGAQSQPSQSNANGATASPSDVDIAKLNADIERLEKAAERNPADEETGDELARMYVRRGDAERAAGQTQEALKDYQHAQRLDPDNPDAQKNAADLEAQVGGEGEDENGAPLPPPITPNVADEDDKPAAKPTPKKK